MRKLILSGILFAISVFISSAQNPYLPLWEHLPDGEPRVFEDPDNPGCYRAYIIGSHDLKNTDYCGPDIRMWSAPVEDLSNWRDEGSLFTYFIGGQWDTMFAPDLVEVRDKATGKKTYYLYPHSRGNNRVAMVAKSDRPNGPFVPVNASEDGFSCLDGSMIDFDPSVFIEDITNRKDPDFKTGFRAYVFYGFQRSTAAELDQNTMYSVRPGTSVHDYFIPASSRYGQVHDPEGTTYPALYEGQNPGEFNFFEASSIRQVGNKYVMVFSGYSGPDYGLESTNSALRYAYGDSPLGPWRSGGVLVDSRGIVLSEDGGSLVTSNAAHNTHGSLQQINGQWYVFYHRPPRGFGYARQAMVAPVKIEWDEKPVAKGGKVRIVGYDPFSSDNEWSAKATDGSHYTGAEVTSEGFQIFGLNPYSYLSAGYACYMSDTGWLQDNWDIWCNDMDLAGITNGGIIGFKYFGFGGVENPAKGVVPFEGTKPGNETKLELFLTPTVDAEVKVHIMLDGPYDNAVWKGKEIAVITVPAGNVNKEMRFVADVASEVEGLSGKHSIYLVVEGPEIEKPQIPQFLRASQIRPRALFDLHGIGFSSKDISLERPRVPNITITVDGMQAIIPDIPVRSTNLNGYTDLSHYQVYIPLTDKSEISVFSDNPDVSFKVSEISDGRATVRCNWHGMEKIYLIN